MTIDERIEKLTERHQALAQSVELLTADVRQQGQMMSELSQSVSKLVGAMTDLVSVARMHERRISDLEAGQ